jgi:hypothetical protein
MSHEERVAYNEAWYRDLNERKAEWLKGGLQAAGFRCECWRTGCGERLRLSKSEWEEVRSEATCFAVAPGHTAGEVEEVVKKYAHFWIVEKRGKAGEVAAEEA